MKKLIYLILAIGIISTAFAEEPVSFRERYNYGKFGGSILYQNIGFGQRTHNIIEQTGSDFSVNSNLLLWTPATSSALIAFPSLKYTHIRYQTPSIESKYFGVGFEALLPVQVGQSSGVLFPVPNIELVWGTEYKNQQYSQFGVNLIPIFAAAAGAIYFTNNPDLGGAIAFYGGVMTLPAIISYTVSF